jgi:arylsulfatase A-like enzyme
MNAEALRLLARAGNRPFFLYLHYMSIHYPYDPPPPYDTLYTERTGPYYYIDGKPERELSPEDVQYIVDRYDGGMNYTDACLKNLFDELERRGKLRNTVVVIMADHGEEFMDYGRLGHGGHLYDMMIRIPLIIFGLHDRFPSGRIEGVAAAIDLYPTLCAIAGVKCDPLSVCGVSLIPLMRDRTPVRQAAFSEYYTYQKSVRDTTHQYIFPGRDGSPEALFDLASDPGETRNILAERPDVADRYRQIAARWLEEMRVKNARLGILPQQVEIDDKTRAGLKSLGYIQ